jgi:hypothetical protein
MIGYASNTGTRKNLNALHSAGWRLLLTPNKPLVRPGFRFGIDNGAWSCYQLLPSAMPEAEPPLGCQLALEVRA